MRTADHSRAALALATGAYLLFVAYQSLAGGPFGQCGLPLTQQGPRLSIGDGIANLIAYLPLGMLATAWGASRRRPTALLAAFVAIAGFSLAMELLQTCLVTRVSSWYDWATNSAGGLLGLMAPSLGGAPATSGSGDDPAKTARAIDAPLFWPMLLCVGAWLLMSVAPWRFTLDVGTLRANLAFLRHLDEWTGPDAWRLLRHLSGWFATGLALRAVWTARGAATLALALAAGVSLAGQAMLVRPMLSIEELLGIAAALACCASLPSDVRGAALARALPVGALVSIAAYQLAPGDRGWVPTDFQWWPQLGRNNLLGAFELGLLFGWVAFALVLSLRWAAARGVTLGRRPLVLPLLMALAMLVLEVAQRWIPGRVADTSAPLITLLAFFVGWSLTGPARSAGRAPGPLAGAAASPVAAAPVRSPVRTTSSRPAA